MAEKGGRPRKHKHPHENGVWARKLLALRHAKGWDQKEAAKNLGISQGNLSNIEVGKYLPSGPLKKLIDLLSAD